MYEAEQKRNPRRWVKLTEKETFIHRNELCDWYSQCLEMAAMEHWGGFSCLYCSLNSRRKERI